ncbi:MAG TPA: hypothetical protein VID77_13660 [Stellaceae bacterium]|jgi:hypothetical protein
MEMKIFRGTNSLEIAKMETAMNDWLKTLPPGATVHHTGTGYCSLDGVPSVVVTVFWSADKPQLPVPVVPAG